MNVDWIDPEIYDQITRSNISKNCPNCGAPIESERCPYCGSLFVDFACIDADQPFYMKIKHNGLINIVKVRLTSVNVHTPDIECLYADNVPVLTLQRAGPTEMTLNFVMV